MTDKTTTNEILGKRLKELRRANGMTIDELAQKAAISKSAVGYYENEGRNAPDNASRYLTRQF